MALNENIMIRLMADTSNYTVKMGAAGAQSEKLKEALEKPVTAGQRLESGLTTAGIAVGALSAAIGVAAVKSFMDFDAAMSAVQANTGATGTELDLLREAALQAGKETVYSATESADAVNELAKAGVSTADILNGGLSGALALAASDQMDVAQAAELTASALNQFGLKGDQAAHVADLLAAGAGTAQGGVADMGEALKMVGVVASQTGMSIEDTTGALTMLASKGIVGSEAGTQLRSALIGLTSASGPVQREMDALGISMYDSQGKFVGLANFAQQLHDALGGLTEEERANAMGILFSNAALSVGNTLYEQGAKGVQKFTAQVNQSGYASRQAAAKTNNLKGDLEQLGGSVETLLINLGSGANGPLRDIVQALTDMVDAFASLPAPVQQTIVLMGGALGAAAGLHKMFGNLGDSTSKFAQFLSSMLDPVNNFKVALPSFQAAIQGVAASFGSSEMQVAAFGSTMGRSQGLVKSAGFALNGLIDLMGGPLGIAMMAAVAVAGTFINKIAQFNKGVKEYVDAMDEVEGSAQKLSAIQGVLKDKFLSDDQATNTQKALKTLGLTYDDLANAMTGTDEEYQKFVNTMQDVLTASDNANQMGDESVRLSGEQYQAISNLIDISQDNRKQITDAIDADKKKQEADKARKELTGELTDATQENTDATTENATASQKAADSSEILADQFGASTDAVNEQATALSEVIDALKTYHGFAISASEADINLHESYDKATESAQKFGKNLDLNTEGGRSNVGALNDMAKAALDAAEAHAKNGESVEQITPLMDDAHERFVKVAQDMGYDADGAETLATQLGITSNSVSDLVNNIQAANATPLTITDNASETLDKVNLKVEALPDGKSVTVSGDNKDAMEALSQVAGVQIDPKTGTLTLDKAQYDVALAIANGATIDEKTGQLLGDNSDYWKDIAAANGWTIDPKTGVISGDDGPFQSAKKAVEDATIKDKKINVEAETTSFWSSINGILGSVFNVKVGAEGGHATGGYITGPGTSTSDSIHARLSNGEYVINAAATKKNRALLDAINYRGYTPLGFAAGGYVGAHQVGKIEVTPVSSFNDSRIVEAIDGFKRALPSMLANAAGSGMSDRDFGRMVRRFANANV
ncbi:MAG: phage tail tape measure protein [Bifidobacterium tsurumiense]|uniref:phage tail tape measure protein n=1 Tax=Bifidobacterium tsurumiense TaxID=356829 RepID=UPI002A809ACA|nr:phage tail tape measure protein [Bifidobacterium tsurumiense]MDY4677585.1 phage tail tape measure protein [Bifidobacterium tsurumiense]